MSVDKVREYLKPFGVAERIQEFEVSSATVELAAQAVGVEPARIAKTLSFHGDVENGCILIATAGDVKIDNSKFKKQFGFKARMLGAEDVANLTGHQVGGVCPFANPPHVTTYLDMSLQRFSTVFPAAGSASSAIELSCDELMNCSGARAWIDVCKLKEPAPQAGGNQ